MQAKINPHWSLTRRLPPPAPATRWDAGIEIYSQLMNLRGMQAKPGSTVGRAHVSWPKVVPTCSPSEAFVACLWEGREPQTPFNTIALPRNTAFFLPLGLSVDLETVL